MIKLKKIIIPIILFIVLFSFTYAHDENLNLPEENNLHIKEYDITFLSQVDKMYTNKEYTFSIKVENFEGKEIKGLEVQGQILDSKVGNEIFFGGITEETPGVYSFIWKPSFAGDYLVQYLFRNEDNEIIQPTFGIRIDDQRGYNAWIIGIIIGLLSTGLGVFFSLPKKNKKFKFSKLIVGIVIAFISIGLAYTVNIFYQGGGEKGFVVCGEEGCEIAVHWHSQLEMNICGEKFNLPLETGDLNKQHTHKERDKLHFHTLIKTDEKGIELLEPEKLRLGELFDFLEIIFSEECFGTYCNGDICPDGKKGKLIMTVNNIQSNIYDDYNWKDGDVIKIEYTTK